MGRWLCPTATSTRVALGLRAELDVRANAGQGGAFINATATSMPDVRLQRKVAAAMAEVSHYIALQIRRNIDFLWHDPKHMDVQATLLCPGVFGSST